MVLVLVFVRGRGGVAGGIRRVKAIVKERAEQVLWDLG
jgi:hypothetical protein